MKYQYSEAVFSGLSSGDVVSNHIMLVAKHKESLLKKIVSEFGYPTNVEIITKKSNHKESTYFVDIKNRKIVAKMTSGIFFGVESVFLDKIARVELKDSPIFEYENHLNS